MRGLDTPIKKIRREIFREIARIAFESDQEHFKYRFILSRSAQNTVTASTVNGPLPASVYGLPWGCP